MKSKFIQLLLIVFWIPLIFASLLWNYQRLDKNMDQTILSIGRSFFKEIETAWLWNARHGGVYVPVTKSIQPNPYLEDPNRDVITTKGVKLTKINPAFMIRQIAKIAKEKSNIQYHLTSLKPLRPKNRANSWEKKALLSFEKGKREFLELDESTGSYRYMATLYVEESCMRCHAIQGYKVGDIRGGVSITIPGADFIEIIRTSKINLGIIHLLTMVLGIVVFSIFKIYSDKQIKIIEEKNRSLATAKAISDFLSKMSHEFRTPLNAILGFSQVLSRNENLGEYDRKNISIIKKSGEYLLSLINDVLDMSKIEAEALTLNYKNFDLFQVLEEIEDMFQIRAEKNNIKLSFKISPGVPRYIRSDELKLRQVIVNLLSNAFKFTEEGSIQLRLRVDKSKPGTGEKISWITGEVEDSGRGIPPEQMDSIFKAFFQAEAGKEASEGTGLGLAISQKFAQLMGGDLSVKSEIGKGSLFSFNIKVNTINPSDIPSRKSATRVTGLLEGEPNYRILVVDDRSSNRQLMVEFLAPIGFELKEASNGKEAIEVFDQWSPHLIWMDMRMPVMNGYEATRRIKETDKGRATIIIAQSASILEEERVAALSAGCEDFIRKPFKEEELYLAIEKHLGIRFRYEAIKPEDDEKYLDKEARVADISGIRSLDLGLIRKLETGLIEANHEKIFDILEIISNQDVKLSEIMKTLIQDFRYQEILNKIQEIKRETANEQV